MLAPLRGIQRLTLPQTCLVLLGVSTAPAMLACGDDTAGAGTTADSSDESTGPGDGMEFFAIPFVGSVGGQPMQCGQQYAGIGTSSSNIELREFAFYVAGVELRTVEGNYVPLQLEQDGEWQYENVALIDLLDHSSPACADTGSAEVNNVIRGHAPAGNYVGARFQLGVPEHMNHLDSAVSPAPLNRQRMWWSWSSGFRYLKADARATTQMPDGSMRTKELYYVHTGANGCERDQVDAQVHCSDRRISTIEVDLALGQQAVHVDAAALFATDDLAIGRGCMGSSSLTDREDGDGVMPTSCLPLYAAMGLDVRADIATPSGQHPLFSSIDWNGQIVPKVRPSLAEVDTPVGRQNPLNWPRDDYQRPAGLDIEVISAPNVGRSHPPGDARYASNCKRCHQANGPGLGQFLVGGSIVREDGTPYGEGTLQLVLAGEKANAWGAKDPMEKVPSPTTYMEIPIDANGQFYTTQAAVDAFAQQHGGPVLNYAASNYQAFILNRDGERVMAMGVLKPGSCNICHTASFKLTMPDRLTTGPWTPSP